MNRIYEYKGFSLEVDVESDFGWRQNVAVLKRNGFVATVRIYRGGEPVAFFSPLRFGDTGGRPFSTEADALMGGFSAGRKIIDDLFPSASNAASSSGRSGNADEPKADQESLP